jgi:hypothetical protein
VEAAAVGSCLRARDRAHAIRLPACVTSLSLFFGQHAMCVNEARIYPSSPPPGLCWALRVVTCLSNVSSTTIDGPAGTLYAWRGWAPPEIHGPRLEPDLLIHMDGHRNPAPACSRSHMTGFHIHPAYGMGCRASRDVLRSGWATRATSRRWTFGTAE